MTSTRTLTAYELDRILQSFIREARRAIIRSEGKDANKALADFNEQLRRRTHSEQIAYCKFWIRMAKVNADD